MSENKNPTGGCLVSSLDLPLLLGDLVEGVITINIEGIIEGFNPAAERMFGYCASEVIGKNVDMLMPKSYPGNHHQYMGDYQRRGEGVVIGHVRELPARRKNGTEFTIELGLSRIQAGGQEFFLGAVRDISSKEPVEQRIRDLARFPDENPNPVMRINADGRILYFNQPSQSIINQWQTGLDELAPDWLIKLVHKGLQSGEMLEEELDFEDKILFLVLAPVLDENYVNVYVQDITERKKAEEQLRQHRDQLEITVKERTEDLVVARDKALEASLAKSSFLANMSHELRTPLNAIIGFSEMLIEDAISDSRDQEADDLRQIRVAGKQLLTLINDILDLSKIEAGRVTLHMEQTNVSALVDEVRSTIFHQVKENNNEFIVDCPRNLNITTDSTKLRQVLYNLLSNAAKFTHDGQVKLVVEQIADEADLLQISVEDTGIGLNEKQVSLIFEPFTQAEDSTAAIFGGTGLGLAIVQEFCRLMGGGITVSSLPGKGSKFVVQIPADGKAENTQR